MSADDTARTDGPTDGPDNGACVLESATDSRLAGEPGPWVIILDCSEHGEVARVPTGDGITRWAEGERVDAAWFEHSGRPR